MTAAYFDPAHEVEVEAQPVTDREVLDLITRIQSISSGRGHPALELRGQDGSSLSLATNGTAAYLVWIDAAGTSMDSVGGSGGKELVYDYFGSWSEAPPGSLIPLEAARDSVLAYFHTGTPTTAAVSFDEQ